MKKFGLILLVMIGVLGTAQAADKRPAPQPASEFDLAQFKGQVVLVDFWASWCGPCRKSLPWLNLMQEKYGAQGLQIVTINLDKKPAAARKMSAEMIPAIRQFSDPEGTLAAHYELEGMPSSFLFDRAGKQLAVHLGFVDSEKNEREQEVQAALIRKEP